MKNPRKLNTQNFIAHLRTLPEEEARLIMKQLNTQIHIPSHHRNTTNLRLGRHVIRNKNGKAIIRGGGPVKFHTYISRIRRNQLIVNESEIVTPKQAAIIKLLLEIFHPVPKLNKHLFDSACALGKLWEQNNGPYKEVLVHKKHLTTARITHTEKHPPKFVKINQNKLRNLITSKGFTNSSFALNCGMLHGTLSKALYKKDNYRTRYATVKKFAKVLDVPITALL